MPRVPIRDHRSFHGNGMRRFRAIGVQFPFPGVVPGSRAGCTRVTHRRAALPLDLHVLGLSLAFILSQDQTLHCMCLFCSFYIVLARASWRPAKKHAGRPSLLVFPRLIRVKEPRSPLVLPPRPRTVPGPKAGAKISQFFIPIQTFLQLFCEKIRPKNPTAWKTTGNRNVFSPAGHVHPGDVLRIPTTKRPHRHARQGRAPRHVGKPGHGTHGLKITGEQPRESLWFPLRNPPTTGEGRNAPRPHPHKTRSVCVHGALRACLRSTFASQPHHCRPIQRICRGCDAKARRTYTITTP